MEDKVLVLCVDRDDDVGRKTDKKGPVIGRKKNLELAESLGLADPEDSDTNAIYQALKIHDSKENSEVATITGDVHVGVESDEKLIGQLEEVLEEVGTEKVILVSDGTEDEHILPIIQSHAQVVSIKRVLVKQSERLEGMYYQMNDFLKEIVNDPKTARLVLGIPALVLILYSLFGATGWRAILGVVGVYLMIKGIHAEEPFMNAVEELKTSFTARRLTFFFYVVSIAISIIGVKSGYDMVNITGATNLIQVSASFLQGSVYLLFIGALIAIVGKAISVFPNKSKMLRYATFTSFLLALTVVGYEATKVILSPAEGMQTFFLVVVFGFIVVSATLTIERVFSSY
ncbi:MAG: DUF373 family protein [Candidatus Aenigmatarchaeota archaeon]